MRHSNLGKLGRVRGDFERSATAHANPIGHRLTKTGRAMFSSG